MVALDNMNGPHYVLVSSGAQPYRCSARLRDVDACLMEGSVVADVRVTCIRKPHPQSPHEHITHVGGNGQVWSREQVVGWIENHQHTFYTLDSAGRRADVRVRREAGKQPYLQTAADGYWTNNLLSLPQCG